MPTIIVLADTDDGATHTQLRERVPAELLVDRHATGQLIERVVLALVEAEQTERMHGARDGGCGCGAAHADPAHAATG